MNHLRLLSALLMGLLATACSTDSPDLESAGSYDNVGDTLRLSPTRLQAYRDGKFRDDYDSDVAAYNKAAAKDKPAYEAAAETERNRILLELTGAVELNYTQYMRDITSGNEVTLWLGDVTNIGLTAAATVTSSASLARLLAGIATGVSGAKLAYEKKVLEDQTIEFLVRQMQTDRDAQEKVITAGMKDTIANYPLEQGILDVWTLYSVGNIPHALSVIDAKLSKSDTEVSPDDLDNLIKIQGKLQQLAKPAAGD